MKSKAKEWLIAVALLLSLCSTTLSAADIIALKSGERFETKIIEKTNNYITIDWQGIPVTYQMYEIESIEEGITVSPQRSPAPVRLEHLNNLEAKEAPIKEDYITPDTGSLFKDYAQTIDVEANSGIEISKWINIFGIAGYLWMALCLHIIAAKLKMEKAWLAWIPIANFYLMCKITKRPAWWILLLFVPIINLIILIVLWMETAAVRNKEEWIGLLTVIPIVNFIVMGYIAFSD